MLYYMSNISKFWQKRNQERNNLAFKECKDSAIHQIFSIQTLKNQVLTSVFVKDNQQIHNIVYLLN